MHLAEKKQKQKAASKTYKFVSYNMKSVDNIELDSNSAVPWGTQILFFVFSSFFLFSILPSLTCETLSSSFLS